MNITNLNRDYLIKINVKEATIDVPKMTFWNTDKKTSNIFVQLVINMSTNELISNYVTVQNATDYKITLNVIKPKTKQYKTIEATLLNEEKALFEIDLPDEFTDQVGDYSFEFEVSSKVDSNDESITTSNGTYKVNGSILTNLNEETSSSPDLPILKQLIEQVKSLQGGDLTGYQKKSDNSLETTSKEVVGAINEVNSQYKDIAKKVENVGQPTQEQINIAINKAIEEGKITGSGGINSTAKTLLETILKNAIYTTDQSANITSLVSALSSGSTPTITYYTITNTLTKCTNGNSNSSVAKNTSYIATIIPNTGYKLDTVTVTMGGTDITSTVYNNGKITINSVTGNIVITATAIEKSTTTELPQDGLDIFFDFRNATVTNPYNLSGWGNVAKVETVENNNYFIFSVSGTYTTDNYGIANFDTRGLRKKASETTKYIGNGTSHTIIGMTYGICISNLYGMLRPTNIPNSISFTPSYKNTGGESKQLATQGITAINPKDTAEYTIYALVMSDTELKLYSDGKLIATVNSSDCIDFVSWATTEGGFGCNYRGANNYMTACAYYNRPLSDVEIVEATEYLKTLEANN